LIAVDLPGKKQASIRVRVAGPTRDDPQHPPMVVGNFVLGGHFLSRLNSNLREEKGWTYGSRSGYSSGSTWGQLTVSVSVQAQNVAATVGEIERELASLTSRPLTDAELESARRSMLADWNRTPETATRMARAYLRALELRTDAAGLQAREKRNSEVTSAEVAEAVGRWAAPTAPRLWVVVGSRELLDAQLQQLGLPVEWVDPTDAIVGRL
jgi:zinc protease